MKRQITLSGIVILLMLCMVGCKKEPQANFSADDTFPIIGQTVSFTDLSSESPTSWVWVFQPSAIEHVEGTSAITQHTKVKFRNAGVYTVTLTASNNEGSDAKTVVDYIHVTEN